MNYSTNQKKKDPINNSMRSQTKRYKIQDNQNNKEQQRTKVNSQKKSPSKVLKSHNPTYISIQEQNLFQQQLPQSILKSTAFNNKIKYLTSHNTQNKQLRKQMLKQTVQQEMLSNYYENKYSSLMNKITRKQDQINKHQNQRNTPSKNKKPVTLLEKNNNKSNRRNFKKQILKKRQTQQSENDNFDPYFTNPYQSSHDISFSKQKIIQFRQKSPQKKTKLKVTSPSHSTQKSTSQPKYEDKKIIQVSSAKKSILSRRGKGISLSPKSISSQKSAKNFKSTLITKNQQQKQIYQNDLLYKQLESSIINQLYSPSPKRIQQKEYQSIRIMGKNQHRHIDQSQYFNQKNQGLRIQINDDYKPYDLQSQDNQFITQSTRSNRFYNPKNSHSSKQKTIPNLRQSIRKAIKSNRSQQSNSSKISSIKQEKNPSNSKHNNPIQSPRRRISESSQVGWNNNFTNNLSQNRKYSSVGSSQSPKRKLNSVEKKAQKSSQKQYKTQNKTNHIKQQVYEDDIEEFQNKIEKTSTQRQKLVKREMKTVQIQHVNSITSQSQSLNQIQFMPPANPSQIPYQSSRSRKPSTSLSFTSQFNQKQNQLSMISRFSMTSQQGHVIKEKLQREIVDNQFGPYQNALQMLRDLIYQYQTAWPIYVVGQRILQDRMDYQKKKDLQTKIINGYQHNIQQLSDRQQQHNQQTDQEYQIRINQLTICRMIRQISKLSQQ